MLKTMPSAYIQTNGCQTKSGVIDMFIHSIRSGIKPEISGEEGFEALSIVLACKESAEEGTSIRVSHYNRAD